MVVLGTSTEHYESWGLVCRQRLAQQARTQGDGGRGSLSIGDGSQRRSHWGADVVNCAERAFIMALMGSQGHCGGH